MKLITEELEKKFQKYPLYSQDGKMGNSIVIVKYFNPLGSGRWYITETEKQKNGKYLFYGYCHLGDNNSSEFGPVRQEDFESVILPLGLTIERDLYLPENITLSEALKRDGIPVPSYLLNNRVKEREGR